MQPAVNNYLIELNKFEYGRSYDPSIIQARFVNMLETFIRSQIDDGTYLAMPYPDNDLGQIRLESTPAPYGFVIHIPGDPATYQPYDFSSLHIHNPPITDDERLIHNRDLIPRMVQGNINHLLEHGYEKHAHQAQTWYKEFSSGKQ